MHPRHETPGKQVRRRDHEIGVHLAAAYQVHECFAVQLAGLGVELAFQLSLKLHIATVFIQAVLFSRTASQRVAIKPLGDNGYDVLSNFSVFFTSEAGESNILAVGKYEDHVMLGGDGARFKKKRAVIDTFLLPRYLVYPI